MMLPRFILHPLIRMKARLHETPLDRYRVFIARRAKHYEDAFKLLHVAYVYQGIESVGKGSMRITPQHVLPESTVFVAYDNNTIVGTITVTLDSPAGLPLDHDYPEQCRKMRAKGALLVEYGSLAVVRRCWRSGVATLLNIAAHWWSRNVLKATDCIIGVNTKIVSLYEALYNFKAIGESKEHAELTAPVQGLTHNLAEAEDSVVHYFTKHMSNGISFGDAVRTMGFPCIDIPRRLSSEELIRWKLPRQVFQEIFMDKSDRLDSLDPLTKSYLMKLRTKFTLKFPIHPCRPEGHGQAVLTEEGAKRCSAKNNIQSTIGWGWKT